MVRVISCAVSVGSVAPLSIRSGGTTRNSTGRVLPFDIHIFTSTINSEQSNGTCFLVEPHQGRESTHVCRAPHTYEPGASVSTCSDLPHSREQLEPPRARCRVEHSCREHYCLLGRNVQRGHGNHLLANLGRNARSFSAQPVLLSFAIFLFLSEEYLWEIWTSIERSKCG